MNEEKKRNRQECHCCENVSDRLDEKKEVEVEKAEVQISTPEYQ